MEVRHGTHSHSSELGPWFQTGYANFIRECTGATETRESVELQLNGLRQRTPDIELTQSCVKWGI